MNESQKWYALAASLLFGWLCYLLAPVLTPFLLGAILAYIGDPVVDRLERWRLSRTLAVITVFLGFSLLGLIGLLILVPMLQRQLALLFSKLPSYIDIIQIHVIPWLEAQLGVSDGGFDLEAVKRYIASNWAAAGGTAATFFGSISRSGLAMLAWLANLILIPVVTFYLLRDWDHLVARIHELIPRRAEPTVVRLAKSTDEVLAAFFRGQLTVMLALGMVYTLGLWLVGLDLALLIGMLSGLVSFVPYLGFIVGIVVAGIAALMQFQDALHLLYVAIVFGVGQMLEGMVLTPLLLGERIGLHPVAVIFAVLAGGQLFGFFGVLMALPVAAVLVVMLRYAHERYLNSPLYASESSAE